VVALAIEALVAVLMHEPWLFLEALVVMALRKEQAELYHEQSC